jgi:glycosyltransferase involved in cell wall biosynthesis
MTSPRIKVLRVIARLNVGGPAIHATLLTERLDPSRYESTLVAGSEEEGEASYLELHGKTVQNLIAIPELGREIRGGQDLIALRRLIALIRKIKPQIVHTHTAKAGALGRLAAIICRVPVVVHTYHGHVLHGYFSPMKTKFFINVERMLARGSSRLLAVTPRVRADLLEAGIGRAERFDVVPLGFDLERFDHASRLRGTLRQELGIGADTPVIGIVARLAPIKAHEVFFDAALRIKAEFPDAVFLIVGDGERRAELEAAVASRGLGPSVRFIGWRGDLAAVYADLDVVALTSKNEGSPVALIEAMACERPVVSTAVGGVRDVVEEGRVGWLAPSGDAGAVADGVIKLLRAPEMARAFGAEGRAFVLGRYGAHRLISDIDSLYRRLLSERGLPQE